jgi:hypothetical protein
MKIDRVTITGADESVAVVDLVAIQRKFPFVEVGILFSPKHQGGHPRYPTRTWLSQLHGLGLNLSAHLCGQWVRDFVLVGVWTWPTSFTQMAPQFKRVQLNFHGRFHQAALGFHEALAKMSANGHEFILQCDGVNDAAAWHLAQREAAGMVTGARCVPLFDRSGGTGVVPPSWPKAWPGIYCGYAGGLGPYNVIDQLEAIYESTEHNARIWIDMETKVRSADGKRFDVGKVLSVLEQVAPMIEPAAETV